MKQEQELKLTITKNHFLELKKELQLEKEQHRNIYYDSLPNKKFAANGSTFRIRIYPDCKNKKPVLTLKIEKKKEDGLRSCEEIERTINPKSTLLIKNRIEKNDLGRKLHNQFVDFGIRSVKKLGSLTTIRHKTKLKGVKIEIDHAKLNKEEEFFEVECENENPPARQTVKKALFKKFNEHGIKKSNKSKYERFLGWYEQ
ncbi:MAG: CYTH domain-containing protein [Candidatus Magasanikbacteria bacterium]